MKIIRKSYRFGGTGATKSVGEIAEVRVRGSQQKTTTTANNYHSYLSPISTKTGTDGIIILQTEYTICASVEMHN